MNVADLSNPWLQNVVFYIGDVPVTYFAIARTLAIVILTYLCVRLSAAAWNRAEQSRPNFNQSHLFVIRRISKFVIVAIGIFVALAFLGMDFSKLTLIASALSIGVGFGLKNIIDNVSAGVVLLFERSIRIGDWVIVGSTEGLVTKINIRSTVIQTWDNADVVVPNADLITAQVTNWTLLKPSGRVRVPVGVAYDTDPELVRTLLLDIANSNQDVIKDGTEAEPMVLFFGFGDSTLNFELRIFIEDIVRQPIVTSNIFLEIARRFRDQGIEIPFPQRDLHIRDWSRSEDDANVVPTSQ